MRFALLFCLALVVATPAFARELPAQLTEADLAPHFAGGALAGAKLAFDSGRYAETLRLLEGVDDSAAVRYLRALARGENGEPGAAARELLALRPQLLALEDRLLFRAGVFAEQAGDPAGAAEAFAAVPSGSLLHAESRLGLSRALRASGRARAAFDVLAAVAKLPEPEAGKDLGAQALSLRAALALQSGDRTARRAALLELWTAHPRSPLAREAGAQLDQIPLEARVRRAERLLEVHRNQEAISELEPLLARLALPGPLACRARFALGDALRKERRHLRALEQLGPVVERCPSVMPRALVSMASSQSIAHPDAGPALYDRLVRDFPDYPRNDEAHWFASALELQAGKTAAARERLSKLAVRFPGSDYAPEALFKLFWLDWKAGRTLRAKRSLDQLLARYSDKPYERQRAEYWRARLAEQEGRGQQAREGFEPLVARDPASYYGAMARARLESLAPERAAALCAVRPSTQATAPWPLATGTLASDRHLAAAVELLRLGFAREAGDELAAIPAGRLPAAQVELLAHLLARAGEAKQAHLLARTRLRVRLEGRPTDSTRATWELAYPLAWRPLIEKHCAKAGVDPDLLQALMREESALDPLARSWAGAVGLTQLLPSRGASVARGLGWPDFEESRLLDPDASIELGCAWLGSLLRRFDGEPIYAWAAYNAEPERIGRWLNRAPGRPLDVFVEEIPIAETRGYVKRLTRTLATYQLLHPRQAASGPLCRNTATLRTD